MRIKKPEEGGSKKKKVKLYVTTGSGEKADAK